MNERIESVVVIDYGKGNLFSLGKALDYLDIPHIVSDDPETVRNAKNIILPGVGAFRDAMDELGERGLVKPLQDAANNDAMVLGICLGMQLFAESSDEFGYQKGLGIVPGHIVNLPVGHERIPNVGWRKLEVNDDSETQFDIGDKDYVYFVHSFGLIDNGCDNNVAGTTLNNQKFVAVFQYRNVVGCQFHPEKSGETGLRILSTILKRKQCTSVRSYG